MKVSELFEAYTPPVKNRKLGYREKVKIPVGGSKEWLKAFGATAEHIEQALRIMRASAVVKKLASLGLTDDSGPQNFRNGSMQFVGSMTVPISADGKSNPKAKRVKFTVQPNGKIDETATNDFHRAPVASGKPHIVPGDPVGSITKSMTNAMEKLVTTMEKRRAKEQKFTAAVKKANAS